MGFLWMVLGLLLGIVLIFILVGISTLITTAYLSSKIKDGGEIELASGKYKIVKVD
jgi:hypothetical protein